MSPIFPADVQERVNALLGTGQYASEAEVLRAAVGALEAQNADMAAIQDGISDMENGRYRPFAEFDADFRKRNQIESDA
jgi:Arc/MetJ-type ribon-helix-helix transcriptional regulator